MTKYTIGNTDLTSAVTNVIWLTATKGVAANCYVSSSSGSGTSVSKLLITNDGGQTWSTATSSQFSWTGFWDNDLGEQADPPAVLTKDSSNNIYLFGRTRYIKWTKGTGDSWSGSLTTLSGVDEWSYGSTMHTTGTDAHTVFYPNDISTSPRGRITLHKKVRSGGSWGSTTTLETYNDTNKTYPIYFKASTLVLGTPTPFYGIIDLDDNTMKLYPSSIMQHASWPLSDAENADITSLQVATTNNGYIHVVYAYSDDNKIYHNYWNGATWLASPIEIASYSNIVGGTGGATSTTSNGFNTTIHTWPGSPHPKLSHQLALSTDGIGLYLFWSEYDSGALTFDVKSTAWNTTSWGTPTIEDTNLSTFTDKFFVLGTHSGSNSGTGSLNTPYAIYTLTNSYSPYAPTLNTLTGGVATSSLTPTLSWNFLDPTPSDSQSAYQIQILLASDSSVVWDSGKVTSTSTSTAVPGSTLSYGNNYQWKVRTYDQDDNVSPYSSLGLFKTSAPPMVTIDSPANAEVITTDSPTITWTYSDSELTAQTAYQIQIINNDVTIYDSGTQSGSANSFVLPVGYLLNGEAYTIRLRTRDSDLIWSDYDENNFTVEFISPAEPSVSSTISDEGFVTLNIGIQQTELNAWNTDAFKIYRKTPSMSDYELIYDSLTVSQLIIEEAEDTTGWSESEKAVTADQTSGKVGLYSLGLGLSEAGDGLYEKTLSIGEWDAYDRIQTWIYTADASALTGVTIKFGIDDSNYFEYTLDSSEMEDDSWAPIDVEIGDCTITGSPNRSALTYFSISINGGTGAISVGDVRLDHIRLIINDYSYTDYTTANGETYTYAVVSFNVPQNLESARAETSPINITFGENRINTYLIPTEDPEFFIKGFMDGSKPPSWTDKTETKYYQTVGSSKPTAVINASQQYIEGSVEIRFFDARFEGQGLTGAKALAFIKNYKPLLLRTWWGENYYISIDGEVNITRKPGIGWFVTFTFTEINE